MTDTFSGRTQGLESPAVHAVEITPHDTNELDYVTRGIYVGTGGDVTVTMLGGETVTFASVPGGVVLPVRATLVLDTGTDAADLVGLY